MNRLQALQDNSLPMAIFFGLLAALIWGAWPVVSRLAVVEALSAADVTALRFGIAGVLLLPIVCKRGLDRHALPGALLLTLGAGAPYVLVAVTGIAHAPASHAGVIIPSSMLCFSTLGAWLLLGDRPSRPRALGLGAILIGVLLTGWQSFTNTGADAWIGDLLFIAAGALWAVYTVGSKALKLDAFHATALVSVISMVLYLPYYLLTEDTALFELPPRELLLQGLFQGVVVAILALVFYTRAVSILGAGRGAIFAALVPAIATILAVPLLGEHPGPLELAGVMIVSLGMIVAVGLWRPATWR